MHLALDLGSMIRKATTYGGPRDPFVRIVDEFEYDAATETLHVNRLVFLRPALQNFVVSVDVHAERGICQAHCEHEEPGREGDAAGVAGLARCQEPHDEPE